MVSCCLAANDFICIADKCKHSCCLGWEIDVDDATYEKYIHLGGALGERVRKSLSVSGDGSRCFSLCENGRCPFLNEKNLCDIISEKGGGYLCEICREHPRFYEWCADVTECGLGLCCEEACRLLLFSEDRFTLSVENSAEDENSAEYDADEIEIYNSFFAFRESLFEIISDSSLMFSKRIEKVLLQAKESELCEDFSERKRLDLLSAAKLYLECEPVDDLRKAYDENVYKIIKERKFGYAENTEWLEKFFSYLLYRHLTAGLYDGTVYARLCFCAEATEYVNACAEILRTKNGILTDKDIIDTVKYWSKQIEYSDVNTEKLIKGENI